MVDRTATRDSDLKDIGKDKKFPARYNNHIDLAKSKLLAEKSYDKPDTLVYIDRLPAEVKNKKGFVYFFKYKAKKDDANWKIATAGLIPKDSTQFEFEKEEIKATDYTFSYNNYSNLYSYSFSGFSDTKIKDDDPIMDQLSKELKRVLYSRRKSAREFYDKSNTDYVDSVVDYVED